MHGGLRGQADFSLYLKVTSYPEVLLPGGHMLKITLGSEKGYVGRGWRTGTLPLYHPQHLSSTSNMEHMRGCTAHA